MYFLAHASSFLHSLMKYESALTLTFRPWQYTTGLVHNDQWRRNVFDDKYLGQENFCLKLGKGNNKKLDTLKDSFQNMGGTCPHTNRSKTNRSQ